ncbi:MAG TPA: hypothetical protein VGA31_02890 [Thermoanaerobaculia bacterium]
MRSTTPNRAGLLLAAALVLSAPVFAQTIVAGSSNPFLAGMPNGSTCCSGDSAPAQSPVLAPGSLTPGTSLTFAVTGSVDHTGGTPTLSPDGSGIFSTPSNNGISGANWPIDALVGVFLDASQPDSSAAPSGLDFTNTSFTTLSPQLKQAFFIGDGLTGTGSGSPQTFVVPAGATRLFLGTSDGFGWFNNSGSFSVLIGVQGAPPTPTPVPGPAAAVPTLSFPVIALLGIVLAGASLLLIRRM